MKLQYLSRVILLTIFTSLSLSGCSGLVNNKNRVPKNSPNSELVDLPTSYDRQAELYEKILLGRIAVGRQRYEQALEYYIAALKITTDIELAREALILSEQLNNRKYSLFIADLWVTLQPDALMPWKLIAFYSMSDQQLEQAQTAIEKIIKLEIGISELLTFFARLSNGHNQKQALELFQSLASIYPENPAITLAMARIHQQREEWSKALVLTHQAVNTQPEQLILWQFHGSMLISSGAKIEAIDWYKKSLHQFPNSDDIRNSLGQLFYELDRFAEAREQFELIVSHSPKDSESKYMIAACYYSEKNYPMSRQYFEPLLRIRRHRNPVLFYLGEMARQDSDFRSAITFYQQISNSPYYETAHILVARLMQEHGDYQQALDYLESLKPRNEASKVEFKLTRLRLMVSQGETAQVDKFLTLVLQQHPDILDVQFYRLQWMIENDEARDIAKLIPKILANFPTAAEQKNLVLGAASMLQKAGITALALNLLNNQLVNNEDTDYRYMRALFAAEMGDIVLAEADFRFILAANPDHLDTLNALGYTLADANKNLQEAKLLIERAYNSNPDSSAIMDSMGWVLYRLGKLSEALEFLQNAYQLEPSDEIASHLGEVLWNMGNKKSAQKILSSAIKSTPESKVIQRTINKFNIKLEPSLPEL